MSKVALIDVTLRDGGYKNNFEFDASMVHSYIEQLSLAKIEYIELGYRKGTHLYGCSKSSGLTFSLSDEFIQSIVEKHPHLNFSVMIHPVRVTFDDLITLKEFGISLVRCCFSTDDPETSFNFINYCRKIGLKVSLNFQRISKFPIDRLIEYCKRAQISGTDMVYFADSNGSLFPDDVKRLFERVNEFVTIPKGFHAHDNTGLALMNSIAAISYGAEYIDATATGMGKGGGNLKLEIITNYLNKSYGNKAYSMENVLRCCELLEPHQSNIKLSFLLNEFCFGLFDVNMDKKSQFFGHKDTTTIDLFNSIIKAGYKNENI